MALTKQDDTGEVTGANSYVDADEFRAYHEDRCNDVSTYGTSEIEPALIKARDYLDTRWEHFGTRKADDQTTEYPRAGTDTVVPTAVKEAQIEYALIELTAPPLWPTPTRDDTGAAIQRKREKVDVIEEEIEYVTGSLQASPSYPVADNKLIRAGLVETGGSSARA